MHPERKVYSNVLAKPQRGHHHFAFGQNWASYAKLIKEPQIEEAKRGPAVPWQAEQISVFDLDPTQHGSFDNVYCWGVLHHTGDMWEALKKAAAMVAPGGLLVLALYRTTKSDEFWRRAKRWYAHASPTGQWLARACYLVVYRIAHMRSGQGSFRAFVANCKSRGMVLRHDVHDWLGGYPYETTLCPEVDRRLKALGFQAERIFAEPRIVRGLLGSGCDEYVYRLARSSTPQGTHDSKNSH